MMFISRHLTAWSDRYRTQRVTKIQTRLTNSQDHIEELSRAHLALLDVSGTPPFRYRHIRIKQRSDLITNKGELEAAKYHLASIEFDVKYFDNAKIFGIPSRGGTGKYTEEMVGDLWNLLVKALRLQEEIEGLKDEVRRLSKDFSEDTFWALRWRMWLAGLRGRRFVNETRGEARKGERALGR